MVKLKNGRWFGRFFAASGEELREMASRLNLRRAINLGGCTVPYGSGESAIAFRDSSSLAARACRWVSALSADGRVLNFQYAQASLG